MLSVYQVADRLGLKPATIRRMVAERRFDVVRINRRVLIPEQSVEAMIAKHTIPAREVRRGR